MSDQKRAAKRFKRENRKTKVGTWYCAGCGERHLLGESCRKPRLFASQNGRTGVGVPKMGSLIPGMLSALADD